MRSLLRRFLLVAVASCCCCHHHDDVCRGSERRFFKLNNLKYITKIDREGVSLPCLLATACDASCDACDRLLLLAGACLLIATLFLACCHRLLPIDSDACCESLVSIACFFLRSLLLGLQLLPSLLVAIASPTSVFSFCTSYHTGDRLQGFWLLALSPPQLPRAIF